MKRRTFMRNALGTAALVSVGQVAINRSAQAEELPLVDPASDQAKALNYTDTATAATHAKYQAGQQCSGCIFYTGAEGSATGPCGVFPGKSVKSTGWCMTFTPKP